MQLLKKHKKASIIISILVLLILGLLLFLNIPEKQKDLKILYNEQNLALSDTARDKTDGVNISENDYNNSDGIEIYRDYSTVHKNILYANLYFYEENTGKVVTLEDVQDYLSQEYEEDGSVRIYNNGKHKKIQKYIEWYIDEKDVQKQSLADLYTVYWNSMKELYPEENPELATNFLELPFDEFLKVMEKYKDPSYNLDIPYDVAFTKGTFK